MRLITTLTISVLVSSTALCTSVSAQPMVNEETKLEINQLYDALLINPTDRSLNLRYSTTLAKAGDYEAAIAPLERILVSEPQNAWLMLQLGILYNSLNSKIMARTYLEQAIHAPNVSSDVVQKAQALLATL